jgi:hypothetical protein
MVRATVPFERAAACAADEADEAALRSENRKLAGKGGGGDESLWDAAGVVGTEVVRGLCRDGPASDENRQCSEGVGMGVKASGLCHDCCLRVKG